MENGNRDGTPDSQAIGRSRSRSHSPHRSRKQASRSRSRSKERDHRRKKRTGSESPKRSSHYQSSYNPLGSRGGYPNEYRGSRYGSYNGGGNGYSSRYSRVGGGRGYSGYNEHTNGHTAHRESPPEGRCLGVFGLHVETNEKKLRHYFEEFGGLEDIQLVYDAKTGRSRGFAFIYFESVNSAKHAKEKLNGIEIDGRKIRVDFSLTQHAHAPTPGVYMGRNGGPRSRPSFGGHGSRYGSDSYARDSYYESSRDRYPPITKRRFSRSRSRSPHYRYDEKPFRGSRYASSGFKDEYSRY